MGLESTPPNRDRPTRSTAPSRGVKRSETLPNRIWELCQDTHLPDTATAPTHQQPEAGSHTAQPQNAHPVSSCCGDGGPVSRRRVPFAQDKVWCHRDRPAVGRKTAWGCPFTTQNRQNRTLLHHLEPDRSAALDFPRSRRLKKSFTLNGCSGCGTSFGGLLRAQRVYSCHPRDSFSRGLFDAVDHVIHQVHLCSVWFASRWAVACSLIGCVWLSGFGRPAPAVSPDRILPIAKDKEIGKDHDVCVPLELPVWKPASEFLDWVVGGSLQSGTSPAPGS